MNRQAQSRIGLACFILFFLGSAMSLLTVLFFHLYHLPFDFPGDSGKYIRPAVGLFSYHYYAVFQNGFLVPELSRLPFYPFFIFGNYKLFGLYNNLAVVLTQSLIMGGVVVAVTRSAYLITPKFFWLAGILVCFCPNLFIRSAIILPDLLFVFFVSWGVYCLICATFKMSFWMYYILGSILFGCALLTRPAFILFPLLTFPFLIYLLFSQKKISFLKSCCVALTSLLIIFMVVSPQILREKHLAKGYLLCTQSGAHPLYWIYPSLNNGWGGRRDIASIKHAKQQYFKKISHVPARVNLTPAQIVHLQSRLAVSLILSIPIKQLIRATVGSSLKLLFYTSFLGTAEAFHHHIPHVSTSLRDYKKTLSDLLANPWQVVIFLSQLAVFLLRGLQILGLVYGILQKEYRAITLYLFSGVLSFVAVSVGLGNPRYRAPIEPMLIIFSVLGMMAICSYLKDRVINRESILPAPV